MATSSSQSINKREVFAWGMFDLANQSFALLINTLLFGLFLKSVVLQGAQYGDFAWSMMASVCGGIVVLLGPILGAMADAKATKKKFLIGSGILCAVMTCGLAAIPSGASVGITTALVIAAALYIPANIGFNIGENFLASFLPEISTRETIGKVSSIGWTMGYVGALILLAIAGVAVAVLKWETPEQHRPILLFAGLWFGVMILPTIFNLQEKAEPKPISGSPVANALKQLGATAREAGSFRDLALLLAAFFIYGMGMQVIVFFAGIIAKNDFGFSDVQLFMFTGVVTIPGAVAAALTGPIQTRLGHKPALLIFLAVWTATALGMLFLTHHRSTLEDPSTMSDLPVWLVGIGIGIGLGGMGTATRATVGALTPAGKEAEFFSLWGTTYKLALMIGLPIFGFIRSQSGSVPSFALLTSFFIVGAVVVIAALNLPRGIAAAEEAERGNA